MSLVIAFNKALSTPVPYEMRPNGGGWSMIVDTCTLTEPQVFSFNSVTSQIDIDVFRAILEKTTWIPVSSRFPRFIFLWKEIRREQDSGFRRFQNLERNARH